MQIERNTKFIWIFPRCSGPSWFTLFLHEEILRACGVEVAEVGVVVDTHMRAERVLGTVEVEIAIGAVGVFGGVADEVTAEAVAHPHPQLITPRVGKRLLVRACRTITVTSGVVVGCSSLGLG